MSPSLPEPMVRELVDTCVQLLTERARVRRILHDLGPSWNGARKALNELATLLREAES
jgi:hypothetical protein